MGTGLFHTGFASDSRRVVRKDDHQGRQVLRQVRLWGLFEGQSKGRSLGARSRNCGRENASREQLQNPSRQLRLSIRQLSPLGEFLKTHDRSH